MIPVEDGLLTVDMTRVTLSNVRARQYHLAWFQSHDKNLTMFKPEPLARRAILCSSAFSCY